MKDKLIADLWQGVYEINDQIRVLYDQSIASCSQMEKTRIFINIDFLRAERQQLICYIDYETSTSN